MSVNWEYYNDERFETLNDKYLPVMGEGDTVATQLITCVNKLIYKWYNDGDVFDNTLAMTGWCNDLSTYANWIHKHFAPTLGTVLEKIGDCYNDDDYEDLLQELADDVFKEELLGPLSKFARTDSIYDCSEEGPFVFEESDEDEYDWY